MSARFGVLPVSSQLLSEADREQLLASYLPALESWGGQRWSADQLGDPLPLLTFVLTGGTEQEILRLREERRQAVPGEPALLLAHPGNNSLASCLEVLARLQQEGQSGRILTLKGPEDDEGQRQLQETVRDVEGFHALRRARIGLLGAPSDWLVASQPAPALVRETWGPQVVPLGLEELAEAAQALPGEAVRPTLDGLLAGAAEVREPSLEALERSVRIYWGLREIVRRYELHALTVRCFDLLVRQGTTGCFALSQLTDEGIVAGCEGDLMSTVGMLWVHELLDRVPWMANPVQVEMAENSLWLAHCTVPRRMAGRYSLRSHFESGQGVGIQGRLLPGPVTLLRIGGREMERLWLAEGEIVRGGEAENLCRTQALVRLKEGVLFDMLRAPLGNHLLLVRGRHAGRLRNWWEFSRGPLRSRCDGRS